MLLNFLVQTLQCPETLILYVLVLSLKVGYFSKIAENFGAAKNNPVYRDS
jgi:hypothetical protein